MAHPNQGNGQALANLNGYKLRATPGLHPGFSNQTNKSPIYLTSHDKSADALSTIHRKEDQAISTSLEDKLNALSIRDQSFPFRPEYVSGPTIRLRTNYFEITSNPQAQLFRYIISIGNLNDKQKRKKPQIIKLLLEDPFFSTARPSPATDFEKCIVTTTKLQLVDFKEFNVRYRNEGESVAGEGAPLYRVRVEVTNTFTMGALMDYLNAPFTNPTFNKEVAISTLNTIIKEHPIKDTNVFSGARNSKFYPLNGGEALVLDTGLIAIKGYYSSVRTSVGRLLLNANVCTSAFFHYGPVDLLMALFGSATDAAEAFLTKRRISTDYLGSKRFKVIEGFVRHPTSGTILSAKEAMFNVQDSEFGTRRVSIAKYFEVKYRNGRPLVKPDLPVILAGTSNVGGMEVPCWLPAEECRLVPGQPYGKKLSSQQTTAMLKFAALPPAENARRIVTGAGEVLGLKASHARLHDFGLKVESNMIVVEGRKLKEPGIVYPKQKPMSATNGRWNLKGASFQKTGELSNWTYLNVKWLIGGPQSRVSATVETMAEFRKVMGVHGFKVPDYLGPREGLTVALNNDWNDIDSRLESTLTMLKQRSIKVLLVILDKEDAYVYSRIKFFADTKYGIHTVHTIASKFMKNDNPIPQPQFIANLALKFNLKLGGVNHALPTDRLGFLRKGTTMVVGMDVVHPSPGQIKDGPSIAAVVASTDKHLAQWPSSLRTQRREYKGADEVMRANILGPMLIERLRLWKSRNGGSLPDRILVYRDGVSESQYEQVLSTEVPVFYQACDREGKASVEIAFIIVGKRHHTRLYPTTAKESDLTYNPKNGNANPQPGTVVDRGVTMENGWDFFLQAHDCLKGTAKPAHYVVLRNDFKDMGAKVLENITHDLCYMFGRATCAVSVAPPARYADLACERGKQYLYKYLTIRPDRSNENDTYDPRLSPWTGSVHEGEYKHPLVDSMFYI